MATTLTSPTEMIAYAAVLREAAKREQSPERAEKIQRTASSMEKEAVAIVSPAGPQLGKLLDTFA
jgi:hypothetical protein